MRGYRVEEWTDEQITKNFKLPLRSDISFGVVGKPPPLNETMVAASLPVYLSDASLLGPDHKDKLSCLAAGFKRLGTMVPPIRFEEMKKILLYAREHIFVQFGTFSPDEIKSTDRWINEVNHSETRKQELRLVYEEMQKVGVLRSKYLQQKWNQREKDPRSCQSFVKDEKYPEEKPLRWINASSDILKVAFGPSTDKCMEKLVEHPALIKKVPVRERAAYIWNYLGGYGVKGQSTDATAMEDHYAHFAFAGDPKRKEAPVVHSDPRYRICNDFMLYMMGAHPVEEHQIRAIKFVFCQTTKEIKDKELTNRVWSRIEDCQTMRSFFKNIIDGYRHLEMKDFGYMLVNAILCSGEMNTSYKNTVTMHVMANYAAFEKSSQQVKTIPCVNEGDDCLAIYPKGLAPDEQWWVDKGWLIKIEFNGPVNESSFCGLVFDPEVQVSVPDVRDCLAKFGWTGRDYVHGTRKVHMSLLRAKALSMACEYNDVPILGPLAHKLMELTKSYNIRESIVWKTNMYDREVLQSAIKEKIWQQKPNIHPKTRLLVFELQNITIDQQIEIERIISNIRLDENFSLPCLDFPAPWVHNMTRCYREVRVPRMLDLAGRQRVVAEMTALLVKSQYGLPVWQGGTNERLFATLDRLAEGRM